MKKYAVFVQAEAEHELKAAQRWIARQSPRAAKLWHDEVRRRIDSLKQFPARCPLAPESESFSEEIRHLVCDKVRVIFTIREGAVLVLHVRHTSQDAVRAPEIPDAGDASAEIGPTGAGESRARPRKRTQS